MKTNYRDFKQAVAQGLAAEYEQEKPCGFDNLVPCTRKCIYYNTCTRNPYKYGADQKEKEVNNGESKR